MGDPNSPIPGIKDQNNEWNTQGHPSRIIHVSKDELKVFAKVFQLSNEWQSAILASLHVQEQMPTLKIFAKCEKHLGDYSGEIYTTPMWHETNSQNDGTLQPEIVFPDNCTRALYVGAYCGLANPLSQTARRDYSVNSDYDSIDLTTISDDYLPRAKYQPKCSMNEFVKRIPQTSWGEKCNTYYMLTNREFVGSMSERTLVSCILPKHSTFIYSHFPHE